jgi:hypothetical protein
MTARQLDIPDRKLALSAIVRTFLVAGVLSWAELPTRLRT